MILPNSIDTYITHMHVSIWYTGSLLLYMRAAGDADAVILFVRINLFCVVYVPACMCCMWV